MNGKTTQGKQQQIYRRARTPRKTNNIKHKAKNNEKTYYNRVRGDTAKREAEKENNTGSHRMPRQVERSDPRRMLLDYLHRQALGMMREKRGVADHTPLRVESVSLTNESTRL